MRLWELDGDEKDLGGETTGAKGVRMRPHRHVCQRRSPTGSFRVASSRSDPHRPKIGLKSTEGAWEGNGRYGCVSSCVSFGRLTFTRN